MSTEPQTPEQWLALGDKLPGKLGEVFTPKEEWKHTRKTRGRRTHSCLKCDKDLRTVRDFGKHDPCSVPDPIKMDLGTALERFRQMPKTKQTIKVMQKIYRLETGERATLDRTLLEWFLFNASAETLLIAAAMAAERSKE